MTALPWSADRPLTMPDRLLTIAEYAELGETDSGYTELQEGQLLMSPSPTQRHMRASGRLLVQLEPQLPDSLYAIQDVDIDLQLVPAGRPGHSRRPDLIVVEKQAYDESDAEGRMLRASEVVVAVEIVSPGSVRMDRRVKRDEYADAGIPHYWILDVDPPISMIDCHLAGELGYQDGGDVTGEFITTAPFPIRLDLDRML